MNPTSPHLAVMEITLFTRDGDHLRAEQILKNLERSDFDPALRLMLLAELREEQQRYVEATEAYSAAYVERPSQRLVMRILRAGWAANLNEPPDPAKDWADLNPDDGVVLKALATWQLGRGQLGNAQHYLERILEIGQKDPMVLNDLAWIYQQTNDERALRTAEHAYDLLPDNAAIADTLGWIQLETGNIEPALELLEKAGKAEPKNPEIQYHLAMAYRKSGDPDTAKQILTDLIQTDKNFPSREAAENALTSL
jgi:tetratricopeptide (TPR) repeat protein